MFPEPKRSPVMQILAICMIAVSIITFAMPYLSLFGSASGFDLLELVFEYVEMPEFGVGIAFICSIIALVFIILSIFKSKFAIGSLIACVGGVLFMIVGMAESIELADIGFYLYVITMIPAIVFSAISIRKR